MALSRRSFLGIAAAGVGGTALAVAGIRRFGDVHVGGVGQPLARPLLLSGRVHNVALTARPADWDIGGSGAAHAWTYNGVVPGPELRVTAGDTLRVALTNRLSEPTTIHWHGVPVPFAMDGVPELTQPPVAPGETFVYEFPVTTPGTYWYHTHVGYQLDRGLYGTLIVEPQRETLAYDREYTLVFDDWLLDPDHPRDNPDAAGMGGMGGMGGMMGRRGRSRRRGAHGEAARVEPLYDALIVNGRSSGPDLRVRRGDRLRLRLINAGSALPVAVWIAGHEMRVTHADGQPLVPRETKVLVLGMGERYDVFIEAANPGLWPVTALAAGGKRATTLLRYDGVGAIAPAAPDRVRDRDLLSYQDLSAAERHPGKAPDRQVDLELSGGMMDPTRWTINGRQYPDTEPVEVRRGERVRLRLFNMSMMPHPIHLHGHFFRVMSFLPAMTVKDRRLGAPILKDTITLGHMETAHLDVVADNPGNRWLLHCHNVYHMIGGMQTELRYV